MSGHPDPGAGTIGAMIGVNESEGAEQYVRQDQ